MVVATWGHDVVARGPWLVASHGVFRGGNRQDRALPDGADRVGAWCSSERLLERSREPVDQPVLAVEVVHRERAARPKTLTDGLHRLQREQIALQPNGGLSSNESERIGKSEEYEV